jgi:hypothetical protein
MGEERRVVGPAPADEAGADPFQGLRLGLGLSLREHLDTLTAAVARQVRQRLQGRPSGGESFQELIKRDRLALSDRIMRSQSIFSASESACGRDLFSSDIAGEGGPGSRAASRG